VMDFILGVMSKSVTPWRLVIGRVGRLGHGELKGMYETRVSRSVFGWLRMLIIAFLSRRLELVVVSKIADSSVQTPERNLRSV
jgi:hypothetical protein